MTSASKSAEKFLLGDGFAINKTTEQQNHQTTKPPNNIKIKTLLQDMKKIITFATV